METDGKKLRPTEYFKEVEKIGHIKYNSTLNSFADLVILGIKLVTPPNQLEALKNIFLVPCNKIIGFMSEVNPCPEVDCVGGKRNLFLAFLVCGTSAFSHAKHFFGQLPTCKKITAFSSTLYTPKTRSFTRCKRQ